MQQRSNPSLLHSAKSWKKHPLSSHRAETARVCLMAQVVIVGGGVIGVCVALSLRRRGLPVLLLEGEAVASAASGSAGG